MADRRISELPFGDLTPNSIIPIISNSITSQTTFGVLLSKIPTSSGSNIDTFTTGGTYSDGTAVFTNTTGGTYSVTGFSIGNEYWSGGTGLNSVVQINSNNQAIGINSFVVGSGNSANSQYSVAMGINSIADGFETLPIKTPITVVSGITMTSSDPNNSTYAVVFSGVNVSAEWNEYLWDSIYWEENLFNISDGIDNYIINGNDIWDIYYDLGTNSTYIADGNITATTYTTISGTAYSDVMTTFDRPAYVIGSGSTATGANSVVLGSNLTGSNNNTTYVDYLNINRFANDNIIFGLYAGSGATDVLNSNFLGQYAGYLATNAHHSNFIGENAGSGATNANNSNFFGQSAGKEATNSNASNFFGQNAGFQATNAINSNFMGYLAGYQTTNAYGSNFFGAAAGYQASGAQYSNLLGEYAGYAALGASYSNFIGNWAGIGATNATGSNFFGRNAGYYAENANHSNFIGLQAGYRATGASYSNLFGYQVGYASTTTLSLGSNNIIIGTNISLLSGTTNSINLGGVLFGTDTYSAITGYPSISAQTTGKIGINVVNPTEALDVSGKGQFTSSVKVGDNSDVASASNVGAIRYNVSGTTSNVDMCMQTGVSAYTWVNIVSNNW